MSEATWRPVDETEAHLISSISDDATCAVYGDWLEERGDIDRAEFLRVFQALRSMRITDPRTVWLSDRLRILRRNVDPSWHAQVERTASPVYVEVAAPAVVPPLPPPQPAARSLLPSVEPPRSVWIATHVPTWIRVGSVLGSAVLVLSFVLYWLL